jgi:hypothetical protein
MQITAPRRRLVLVGALAGFLSTWTSVVIIFFKQRRQYQATSIDQSD